MKGVPVDEDRQQDRKEEEPDFEGHKHDSVNEMNEEPDVEGHVLEQAEYNEMNE